MHSRTQIDADGSIDGIARHTISISLSLSSVREAREINYFSYNTMSVMQMGKGYLHSSVGVGRTVVDQ